MPDLLTPIGLFLPVHLLAYFIVVLTLLLFLAFPGKEGKRHRKGIGYGLLLSPCGLIVPWMIGALLIYLHGVVSRGTVLHDALIVTIMLTIAAGPLVGPPITITLVAIRLWEKSSEAKASDSEMPLERQPESE